MMPRKIAQMEWEQGKAILSLAGIRELKQATIAPTTGANAAYTVTEAGTRRVVAIHLGAANGDIRYRTTTAASATNMPVIPARYFVIDCKKNDVLNFFNTSAGTITINLMEIE